MEDRKSLLEDLTVQVGCPYLSDLRTERFQAKAIHAALACSPDEYAASQWQDAANYLLEREGAVESTAAARALLETFEQERCLRGSKL